MPHMRPSGPREWTVRAVSHLAVRKAEALLAVVMTPFGVVPARRSIGLRACNPGFAQRDRRT